MKIDVFPDYETLCAGVADAVAAQLHQKPDSVLVFPTGNTPLGLFKVLVTRKLANQVSFDHAQIVILDEYAGLAPNDPRSLTDWLKRELIIPAGIPTPSMHGFGHGTNRLEDKIHELGGLDLVILGLGPNGHLGFNEPGSAFNSRTRQIDLAPESITSNAAYWGSEDRVPRHGMTLGLGTLAEARSLILMVSGESKRGILSKTMKGSISPANPGTMLRQLPQTRVLADKAAIEHPV